MRFEVIEKLFRQVNIIYQQILISNKNQSVLNIFPSALEFSFYLLLCGTEGSIKCDVMYSTESAMMISIICWKVLSFTICERKIMCVES